MNICRILIHLVILVLGFVTPTQNNNFRKHYKHAKIHKVVAKFSTIKASKNSEIIHPEFQLTQTVT